MFIESIWAKIPLKLHLVELIIPLMLKFDDCERERFVATKLFEYDSYWWCVFLCKGSGRSSQFSIMLWPLIWSCLMFVQALIDHLFSMLQIKSLSNYNFDVRRIQKELNRIKIIIFKIILLISLYTILPLGEVKIVSFHSK